jgi:hypothetical protein
VLDFPLAQQFGRVPFLAVLAVDVLVVREAEQQEVLERVPFLGRQVSAVARCSGTDSVDVGNLGVLLELARADLEYHRVGAAGRVAAAVADRPEGGLHRGVQILAVAGAVGARRRCGRHADRVRAGYDVIGNERPARSATLSIVDL